MPLWLGVVVGVGPRGVCEAGAQWMCFRNGSISRDSLPLWLGAVAGVGPRGVSDAGVCVNVFPQWQQFPRFGAIVGYSGIPASGQV